MLAMSANNVAPSLLQFMVINVYKDLTTKYKDQCDFIAQLPVYE